MTDQIRKGGKGETTVGKTARIDKKYCHDDGPILMVLFLLLDQIHPYTQVLFQSCTVPMFEVSRCWFVVVDDEWILCFLCFLSIHRFQSYLCEVFISMRCLITCLIFHFSILV